MARTKQRHPLGEGKTGSVHLGYESDEVWRNPKEVCSALYGHWADF